MPPKVDFLFKETKKNFPVFGPRVYVGVFGLTGFTGLTGTGLIGFTGVTGFDGLYFLILFVLVTIDFSKLSIALPSGK